MQFMTKTGNMKQSTGHVVMIRPKHFGFNIETAGSNVFQSNDTSLSSEDVSRRAVDEFDLFVDLLREHGIEVLVIEDSDEPFKPDAIFPNNWFSTHEDGALITYPMFSPARRHERREEVIGEIGLHYEIGKRYSFEQYEENEQFLEGTGSLVLDRVNGIAYACLSPRTDLELLDKFCVLRGFEKVTFHAFAKGEAIYHTNVVMALGEDFAVICAECIADEKEKKEVLRRLSASGKEIIEITEQQMFDFAGNMLELKSKDGENLCVMSLRAYQSLDGSQIKRLEKHSTIVSGSLEIIEQYGGGSARCMIAENFLTPKD